MKRFLFITLTLLVVLAFTGGCSSISKIQVPKLSGASKESEEGLYRKVPASLRADVKEAKYDLKRAKSNSSLAEKKLKLSDLKKEREILRNEYAKHNKKLAQVLVEKANIGVEIKKMEAIDNSNLGDKAGNIKRIASLKTKSLSIESGAIEIKADMDTTKLEIKQLTKQIILQEKKIRKK